MFMLNHDFLLAFFTINNPIGRLYTMSSIVVGTHTFLFCLKFTIGQLDRRRINSSTIQIQYISDYPDCQSVWRLNGALNNLEQLVTQRWNTASLLASVLSPELYGSNLSGLLREVAGGFYP